MSPLIKAGLILLGIIAFIVWIAFVVMGEGALKRHVTFSGVYSICKPDGYEVVCFLDADGKEGGIFRLPLKDAGGKCK